LLRSALDVNGGVISGHWVCKTIDYCCGNIR
jgi:hypothetical protein